MLPHREGPLQRIAAVGLDSANRGLSSIQLQTFAHSMIEVDVTLSDKLSRQAAFGHNRTFPVRLPMGGTGHELSVKVTTQITQVRIIPLGVLLRSAFDVNWSHQEEGGHCEESNALDVFCLLLQFEISRGQRRNIWYRTPALSGNIAR
jgi:hypothetical protein